MSGGAGGVSAGASGTSTCLVTECPVGEFCVPAGQPRANLCGCPIPDCEPDGGVGGSAGAATGGTIATNGNFIIHTFSNVGDTAFAVSGGSLTCQVLVVAGGGAGGYGNDTAGNCGGGGAGGLIYSNLQPPLNKVLNSQRPHGLFKPWGFLLAERERDHVNGREKKREGETMLLRMWRAHQEEGGFCHAGGLRQSLGAT